jgi:1-acyl-sn-glycerol-3-phosphate acyltransferase
MGAFMLAARTGAPVLPVSLIGIRTLCGAKHGGRITASSRFASKNRYLQ